MKKFLYILLLLFIAGGLTYFFHYTYVDLNCKLANSSNEINECVWNRGLSDINKILYYRSKQSYLKTEEELRQYYSLISLNNIYLDQYKDTFLQDKIFLESQSEKCYRENLDCFSLYMKLKSPKLSNIDKAELYENQLIVYGICDKGPFYSFTDLYINYQNLVQEANLPNKLKLKEKECEDNKKKDTQRYEEWNSNPSRQKSKNSN
jgi:hypothetical protein